MKSQHQFTRREFLVASTSVAAFGLLSACAKTAGVSPTATPAQATVKPATPTTPPLGATTTPVPTVVAPTKYQQNPMWDELVAAGTLPPVDERLPVSPTVAPRSGKYGGVPAAPSRETAGISGNINLGGGVQTKMRLMEDFSLAPNLYKDVVYSNDYKTLTFYMREGCRWSDGEPYTANDCLFFWEDVVMNDQLTTAGQRQSRYRSPQFTLVDDYTWRFDWDDPYPSYLRFAVAHIGGGDHALPAHYMKQFHIKYNPKADEEAKAEGFDSWFARFTNKADVGKNKDCPHVRLYVTKEVKVDRVELDPNPYYWMVDQDGQQLPYFDGQLLLFAADNSVRDAMILTGDIDVSEVSWANYESFKDGEEAGHYKVYTWKTIMNRNVYNLNLTCEDEVWREVFRDVRFRRAMSVAIDRDELNNVLYNGLATPGQFTCHVTSRAYKQEHADAWAQYDPDLANELLDEMGLEWDDKHELRTLPDGRPTEFDTIMWEAMAGYEMELTVEYWKNIGIQVNYKGVERSLLAEAQLANKVWMSAWNGDGHADVRLCQSPGFFAPVYNDTNCTSTPWGLWYNTKGEQGEEPIPEVKQLYEWMDEFQRTDNWELVDKIMAFQAENLYTIGTMNDPPKIYIHDADMKNVPDFCYSSWDNNEGKHRFEEAFYFDR